MAGAVVKMAAQRAIVRMARDIEAVAADAPSEWDVQDLVQMAEGKLLQTSAAYASTRKQRFEPASVISAKVVDALYQPELNDSVSFGLTELDAITAGMRPKEMIVVGARPGMGKTAFATAISLRVARQKRAVAFFSMEMDAASIIRRALTSLAYQHGHNIAYEALRKGGLTIAQKDALASASTDFNSLPFWIHEGRDHKPSALVAEARRMQTIAEKMGTPLGLIVVDHIQKVVPERDARGNKVAEVTEVSDALQKMAGALNCPVMALSQLNRGVEGREDKRPELRDLRESGAIEQDADLVMLLHREAYYLSKKEPNKWKEQEKHNDWYRDFVRVRYQLDVMIAKQRNGAEGTVMVHFDAPTGAMKDW
jgi:replicative DNA helicase